mmetsp:Transcript_7761/g.12534  ORF Transcript_7761/g.12534 Transcript_7761/m.12534 type:complete len:81 (+) Transcript_7761:259-501(+)
MWLLPSLPGGAHPYQFWSQCSHFGSGVFGSAMAAICLNLFVDLLQRERGAMCVAAPVFQASPSALVHFAPVSEDHGALIL